jgi:hypothetical protein
VFVDLISDRARKELGLTVMESAWVFHAANTTDELSSMVEALTLIERHRLERLAEHNTECPHCYGTGKQGSASCGPCHGKGWF